MTETEYADGLRRCAVALAIQQLEADIPGVGVVFVGDAVPAEWPAAIAAVYRDRLEEAAAVMLRARPWQIIEEPGRPPELALNRAAEQTTEPPVTC